MLKQLNFKEFLHVLSLLGKRKPAYIVSLTFFSLAYPVVQILIGFVYKALFNSMEASRGVILSKGLIAMVMVFLAACLIDPVSGYFYQMSIKKATLGVSGIM
jgi:Na+/H+ antiporter NhaA